jgi:glycosyltransferase involved in cell wall biosynthesis
MRIAMIGTRGVPARYGGFETAIEEIGRRIARDGDEVVVYCRGEDTAGGTHLGMELHHLPAVRSKAVETLSHTLLSVLHAVTRRRTADVAFVFNAANAVFVPLLRLRGIPVAVHVDGLEWKRAKWGTWGRRYYRMAEALSVRWADALIADADGIADYYTEEFGAPTELIAYGAPILSGDASDLLRQHTDLAPRGYHLVVARFEPENHVLEIVRGYTASAARLPLVVVGSAPYSDAYTAQIESLSDGDGRVSILGAVWDQDLLDQLYANAACYLHGHSVGGTNPSLLRAMGAGTTVAAFDVSFNRGVLGEAGHYFSTPEELADLLAEVEAELDDDVEAYAARVDTVRERARLRYDWDDVARAYRDLAERLHRRVERRPRPSGRRRR